MCGRARCSLAPEDLCSTVNIPEQRWKDKEKYQPSYNVSPGFWLPVIKIAEDGNTELHTMKWGLIPSFNKNADQLDHYKMFNARSETVAEKPVFSRLIGRNHCLVVLNGFYEWKAEAKGKQPYYIYLNQEQKQEDEGPQQEQIIYMAGLYDKWCGPDEQILYSFTILTADSSKRIEWLHNRMPVILRNQQQQQNWLLQQNSTDLQKLFVSYNEQDLNWHPVTKSMSNSKYQSQDCADDVRNKGIGKFWGNQQRGTKRKIDSKVDGEQDFKNSDVEEKIEKQDKKQKFEEQQLDSLEIQSVQQKQEDGKNCDQNDIVEIVDEKVNHVEKKKLLFSYEKTTDQDLQSFSSKQSFNGKKKVVNSEKVEESNKKNNTLFKYFQKK